MVIGVFVAAAIMLPKIWGPVLFVGGTIVLAGLLWYMTSNI